MRVPFAWLKDRVAAEDSPQIKFHCAPLGRGGPCVSAHRFALDGGCKGKSVRRCKNQAAVLFPAPLGRELGTVESAVSLLPIHNGPPALQIIVTPVFVLEVVGMLPDVVDQNGEVLLHQRIVVTGGGVNLELAPVLHADDGQVP